ncbi:MAG: GNAT family N-acetyltransferase [Anaerolineales bacterium]|nr:GNAT family N-acetyltransferase [Anaerolineales bacterium]
MDFTLQPATLNDKSLLRNLLELCQHDYSEYNQSDINPHGLFTYAYLDHYWTEAGRYAFLVRVAENIAGFVLVRALGDEEKSLTYSMAEFFILRKYRRRGLGRRVAQEIFKGFPGHWRVSQEIDNCPAQAFWRNVIADYTGGNYKEVASTDDCPGPTQIFHN